MRGEPETPSPLSIPADFFNAYAALGVANFSNGNTIQAAYLKGARKHNPDKGGDSEQFKKISAANELLKNPAARFTWHVMPKPQCHKLDYSILDNSASGMFLGPGFGLPHLVR